MQIYAPFTPEQANRINEFQCAGYMHPFTCGGCSGADLIATEAGLHCPNCDYRQTWVHDFMADGSAVKSYRRMFTASGIETHSATTAGRGPQDESPTAATSGGDAQERRP